MRFKFWKLFIPAGSVYIPSQCDGAFRAATAGMEIGGQCCAHMPVTGVLSQ